MERVGEVHLGKKKMLQLDLIDEEHVRTVDSITLCFLLLLLPSEVKTMTQQQLPDLGKHVRTLLMHVLQISHSLVLLFFHKYFFLGTSTFQSRTGVIDLIDRS